MDQYGNWDTIEEYQDGYDRLVDDYNDLEMDQIRARKILDPENRFESLEDAARNRMQQIVALEAMR